MNLSSGAKVQLVFADMVFQCVAAIADEEFDVVRVAVLVA